MKDVPKAIEAVWKIESTRLIAVCLQSWWCGDTCFDHRSYKSGRLSRYDVRFYNREHGAVVNSVAGLTMDLRYPAAKHFAGGCPMRLRISIYRYQRIDIRRARPTNRWTASP